MRRYYLLTPGPTPVPPEVAQKEGSPILHHRTEEFAEIFQRVSQELSYVFQTADPVYILASSGTGAMETAVVNLMNPGEKVLVSSCGNFGERWIKLVNAFGGKVVTANSEWGEAVEPERVEKELRSNPDIRLVFTTHTETSTGVVNDLAALAEVSHRYSALLVVDAISSLAGQELRTASWGVDVVVAGSQKGLMLPPGLAFISLNSAAWEKAELCTSPRFYWDLRRYRDTLKEGQTPFTPAVSLLVALGESLRLIRQNGLENIWEQYQLYARACREAMTILGLRLFAKRPAAVVTSVSSPDNLESGKLVKIMRQKYGVAIAGGQGKLKGKIFRFAHMGYITEFDLLVGIAALERVLDELGYSVTPGKGIARFQEVLMSERIAASGKKN